MRPLFFLFLALLLLTLGVHATSQDEHMYTTRTLRASDNACPAQLAELTNECLEQIQGGF